MRRHKADSQREEPPVVKSEAICNEKMTGGESNKRKWKPGDLVLNMSSKNLSAHEKEVLQFGIKFSPYPSTVNTFQCLKDMRAFNRRMRLREFFIDSEKCEEEEGWMKTKKASAFTPPKNRETNLDSYLDIVNGETMKLLKIDSDAEWKNMSENQKHALEDLKKNKDITIKPADKGGALTVMDTEKYNEAIVSE